METVRTMPLWVDVFIAIVAALGGWEAIKYLISLGANRRKDKAEATQGEALAGQQDADWRKKELDLMTSIVDTTQNQYEDLKGKYDELKSEKDEDRKIKSELRMKLSEHERKLDGLQRAFTESESKRRSAERLYCSVESCPSRHPPLGTYDSTKDLPRRKNGQFAPRRVATDVI